MTKEYEFTEQWFSAGERLWPELIPFLPDRKKFLEIGSYEGRSSVWLIEHMMQEGSKLFCIDTWEGGEEHDKAKMLEVEDRFHSNVSLAQKRFPGRKVYSFRSNSLQALSIMNHSDRDLNSFDFIYIDGSHVAKDVLTDACLAWPILKPGGVLVFDDYVWGNPRDILHRPKAAIDAFVNIFAEEIEFININYQVALRKKNGQI